MKYLVLAYYSFNPVENPHEAIQAHKTFFKGKEATGRLYISEQGINGQMSALEEEAMAYMEWLNGQKDFEGLTFKAHRSPENVFPRMTVKYRKQLVALDSDVDLSKRGAYLTPQEWRTVLESDEDILLIDVRNDYETAVGHFEGAVLPECKTFREFPAFADQLKEKTDPKKKVLMCCTGGIRCELFSAVLKEKGFENVFQLKGGIIQYGLDEGTAHWKGKLFVFDDRLTIPIDEQEETATIGSCHQCQTLTSAYYNCCNMDCNELFLCCSECAKKMQGCCSEKCMAADRMRTFDANKTHKPFRRKHLCK